MKQLGLKLTDDLSSVYNIVEESIEDRTVRAVNGLLSCLHNPVVWVLPPNLHVTVSGLTERPTGPSRYCVTKSPRLPFFNAPCHLFER